MRRRRLVPLLAVSLTATPAPALATSTANAAPLVASSYAARPPRRPSVGRPGWRAGPVHQAEAAVEAVCIHRSGGVPVRTDQGAAGLPGTRRQAHRPGDIPDQDRRARQAPRSRTSPPATPPAAWTCSGRSSARRRSRTSDTRTAPTWAPSAPSSSRAAPTGSCWTARSTRRAPGGAWSSGGRGAPSPRSTGGPDGPPRARQDAIADKGRHPLSGKLPAKDVTCRATTASNADARQNRKGDEPPPRLAAPGACPGPFLSPVVRPRAV